MILGFTYDEKIFNKENRELLLKAEALGLKSLELSPDLNIMSKEEYEDVMRFAEKENLGIHYHIPYFASEYYSPKYLISDEETVLKKYDEFFGLLKDLDDIYSNKSTVILHGEDFLPPEDKSYERTEKIVRYCLQKIEELNLDFRVAIETLRGGKKRIVGDCHEDLLYLMDKVDSERFGICLDICHDCMNTFPYKPFYSEKFLKNLIHVHAHGIDLSDNNPHISIIKSSVNFMDIILFLKERKPELNLNIELLSDYSGDETYISDLFFDLHILDSLITPIIVEE